MTQRDPGLSGHGVFVEFAPDLASASMTVPFPGGRGGGGGGKMVGGTTVAMTTASPEIKAAEDFCRLDVEEATRKSWFARLPS